MNRQTANANLIAYLTLARREVQRFMRIWLQTLLPPAITTALYFMIFGKLIGQRIGVVDGVNYIEYIAPGLIMMAVLMNSYSNVSSSFYSTKFHRNIEEQLVSPMPDALIVLGYVTGGLLRGLAIAVIVSVVTMFFTRVPVTHPLATVLLAVLTATVFSFAGFINALYAKSFDDISIVPTFVLAPLTYLGGIFYATSMLSPGWQLVAQFNPLLYVINGFRYAMLGFSDVPFAATLAVLSVSVVILYFLSLYLMKHSNSLRS